jgi:hypothetical protein
MYVFIRRTAYTLACLLASASGSLAGVLHPMQDFDWTPQIGLATAEFRVPPGWRALPFGPEAPAQVTLVRVASEDRQHEIVATIDFYHLHSFQKDKTQQGCADEYLDGIQRHADKNVEMDIVSTFYISSNGAVNIYRYHSDYWRERWAAFIVKGDYLVQVEIYAHDFANTALFAPYLELIAQGISINQS